MFATCQRPRINWCVEGWLNIDHIDVSLTNPDLLRPVFVTLPCFPQSYFTKARLRTFSVGLSVDKVFVVLPIPLNPWLIKV
jgi:hypothetical protein